MTCIAVDGGGGGDDPGVAAPSGAAPSQLVSQDVDMEASVTTDAATATASPSYR